MKSLAVGLSHACRCRLPGWGSCNNYDQWPKMDGIVKSHSQQYRSIQPLSCTNSWALMFHRTFYLFFSNVIFWYLIFFYTIIGTTIMLTLAIYLSNFSSWCSMGIRVDAYMHHAMSTITNWTSLLFYVYCT